MRLRLGQVACGNGQPGVVTGNASLPRSATRRGVPTGVARSAVSRTTKMPSKCDPKTIHQEPSAFCWIAGSIAL
jgi:hypothetical protein